MLQTTLLGAVCRLLLSCCKFFLHFIAALFVSTCLGCHIIAWLHIIYHRETRQI